MEMESAGGITCHTSMVVSVVTTKQVRFGDLCVRAPSAQDLTLQRYLAGNELSGGTAPGAP